MGEKANSIEWGKDVIWFDPEEFDDPDHPGSWVHLDALTVIYLERIRLMTGWPIITHNKFGLHGCVTVAPKGHSDKSRHYIDNECDAVDWHFDIDIDPRIQAKTVLQSDFTGVGVYYDWKWNNKKLNIGFHVDRRERPQYWKREKGEYFYLLK